MPKIIFVPNNVEVEVPEGTAILDAALDNNIRINHNCGGNCTCSTCHVIVEDEYEFLGEMSEDEADMLDEIENLSAVSRLACQVKARYDLVIRIPETTDDFQDDQYYRGTFLKVRSCPISKLSQFSRMSVLTDPAFRCRLTDRQHPPVYADNPTE